MRIIRGAVLLSGGNFRPILSGNQVMLPYYKQPPSLSLESSITGHSLSQVENILQSMLGM